ncbi:dynein heavy chain axonemal-like [Limosa lapponica baueri]|uniref:Dynein heavy chain axonemal-like n=1 Tax=Limosa lapponica baueri TaxID=1758121 RepID=A0A2I0UTL1_LIMLA|nr:dynein heavy chain axonemal-like [Limosa lapponica baueri]
MGNLDQGLRKILYQEGGETLEEGPWDLVALSRLSKKMEYSRNKFEFTIDSGELHNVSLGQGQEAVAEIAMEKASKEGHWVILQFDRKSVLASGFAVSSNLDYEGYHKNMDEMLPPQSPIRYGLHPNVEIAFVIITAANVLHMLLELQFKYSVTGEGLSQAVEDKEAKREALDYGLTPVSVQTRR